MPITAADELQHAPSQDPHWRESCYFSFHDSSGKLGGMASVGIFPNQDRVEGFAAILAQDRVLFYHAQGSRRIGEAHFFSADGIVCEPLRPLEKWSFSTAADFGEVHPEQMAKGMRPPATVSAGFSLIFHALSPIYDYGGSDLESLSAAARHFEQTGYVEGRVCVGGEVFTVSGLGSRDRSWGPRDLTQANDLLAIYAQLSPYLAINAVRGVHQDQEIAVGYVFRQGLNSAIDDVQAAVAFDQESNLPTGLEAEITTSDGRRLHLQAAISTVVPILLNQPSGQLQWFECSARCHAGRETGYGVIEVTRLV